MQSSGPIVTGILIPAGAKMKEITMDMTPSKNTAAKILKGSVTFIGAMPEIDVIIMGRRDMEGLSPNQHKLPKPYTEVKVNGDVLLVRMDENSEPQNLTMKEYEAYVEKKNAEPDAEKEEEADYDEGEEDVLDDEEDEDYDEDEDEDEDGDEDEDEEEGDGDKNANSEEIKDTTERTSKRGRDEEGSSTSSSMKSKMQKTN
eukprot:CAMPEP_0114496810 /NCGR_PEP_ID=MMETSP0109-20121206/5972_1 /TAXON_ID=29199 /ORGANISM="Chlorarachnion reptans, Strain CCCM449" /LENGTH=200 /DNA_ID=CAMNT_0001674115 /DNA_START=107 /DNA_END=709 /DNA_ORIENTATION=-